MSIELKNGERLEDLQFKGLRIIQSGSGFRFGTDSVLLAGFAKVGAKDCVLDMGSGTGVIAILLEGRTGAKLTGVEIQAVQCDMAARSAKLNGQDIEFIKAYLGASFIIIHQRRFAHPARAVGLRRV